MNKQLASIKPAQLVKPEVPRKLQILQILCYSFDSALCDWIKFSVNVTVCIFIIIMCLEDLSQWLPGISPPITAVSLSLKQKVDVDRQAKYI